MYGGPTVASPQHGLSAMDMAASQVNNRSYYRMRGEGTGGDDIMGRPGTTSSARTSPLNNRSSGNNAAEGKNKGGVSATGLIRLTLKKPMGIVFEPMEDPHNPSQQRGVRICDLPRTGAAAMCGKLEIGDELLSINNKTMSRLTFDEIMDFIIEADADSINLLFRRPKKEGRSSTAADTKRGSNVKWVDNSKDNAKKVVTEEIEPEPEEATIEDEETLSTRSPSPKPKGKSKGKEKNKRPPREEESLASADDTFYTEATDYTEETRQKRRKGRRNRKIESETFLDMLIDSICAPVMGDLGKKGDYSDDDETYNSADDGTYDTYDDSYDERRRRWNERKKRDKEMREKSKQSDKRKSKKGDQAKENIDNFQESKPFKPKIENNPYNPRKNDNGPAQDRNMISNSQNPPPPPPPPPPSSYDNNGDNYQMNMNQPPGQTNNMDNMNNNMHNMNNNMHNMNNNMHNMNNNMHNMNNNMNNMNLGPQNRFNPNLGEPKNEVHEESLIPDPNCPIKELEYDDRVDHAAEVSVMDSIGGPSLLLENLRNASKIVKTVTPEIIQKFGAGYPQELGLTREESIQVDPNKFYRWVVKILLEAHEPEKIRLIDKLFEKYKGREEHLIHKLNARYTDDDEKSKKAGAVPAGESIEPTDYDGFKPFGGGDFSNTAESRAEKNYDFGNDGWPATIGEEDEEDDEEEEKEVEKSMDLSEDYSEAEYESVDGTSPEVIAQVSELLNYVYGKTSVPGQIDRVSTIMRAYEGRTGVLLELLETKALLKANADTENVEDIPDSLRSNPGLQTVSGESMDKKQDIHIEGSGDGEPVLSPISNLTGGSGSRNEKIDVGARKKEKYPEDDFEDDFENKPIDDGFNVIESNNITSLRPQSSSQSSFDPSSYNPSFGQSSYDESYGQPQTSPGRSRPSSQLASSNDKKKKKKGFFGMFKKKKGKKDSGGAFPSSDSGFKKNKRGALLG